MAWVISSRLRCKANITDAFTRATGTVTGNKERITSTKYIIPAYHTTVLNESIGRIQVGKSMPDPLLSRIASCCLFLLYAEWIGLYLRESVKRLVCLD